MSSISPFLWFDTQAFEAAQFYVSLFPNSSITNVSYYPPGSPVPEGSVFGVSFELDGVQYQALNGGPHYTLTPAFSLYVSVETQEEIDRLWDALVADGGKPSQCGWLIDRFGLSWQVIPPILQQLLSDADPEKAGRTMQAMLAMAKIDIAGLQAAHDGTAATGSASTGTAV